jgi:hypothetical protein
MKSAPDFFLREWKRSKSKAAEEYCWAKTQAAGGLAGADQFPVCWSLDLSWNSLYIHM